MVIQIVSDLHLEHGNPIPALAPEADVLVVAGDVAPVTKPWLLGDAVDEWLACERTLYVPGNHEYYGSEIDHARDTLARAEGTPSVVITHHAPSGRSIGAQYEGDPTSPAFANDLEALIGRYQPTLWIHGHMHDRVDYQLGDTRVICNEITMKRYHRSKDRIELRPESTNPEHETITVEWGTDWEIVGVVVGAVIGMRHNDSNE